MNDEPFDELFERAHMNCELAWICLGCKRPVCPRCEPSPGEQYLCPDCHWSGAA